MNFFMLIRKYEGTPKLKLPNLLKKKKKSWIPLFPAGLKCLDVAGLLNIWQNSAGNWLTACLSDMFNGYPLWDKEWGGSEKEPCLKQVAH